MKNEQIIKVGVGVMIFKYGKLLLSKRKGAHGEGEYAFPGGHLEFGESIQDCAHRECMEECGIKIDQIDFLFFKNMRAYNKHYAHIGVVAQWKSGEPQNLEPNKAESWRWYDLTELPKPLFLPVKESLKCYKEGINFID